MYSKIMPAARFGSAGIGNATFDKATDGDPHTAFDSVEPSEGIAGMDAGRNVVVSRLRYWPREWNGKRMVGGRFEAAENSSGPWTVLYTIATEPANGRFTEVDLPKNHADYRYYRYVGPKDGHANIAEMEFFEGGQP